MLNRQFNAACPAPITEAKLIRLREFTAAQVLLQNALGISIAASVAGHLAVAAAVVLAFLAADPARESDVIPVELVKADPPDEATKPEKPAPKGAAGSATAKNDADPQDPAGPHPR